LLAGCGVRLGASVELDLDRVAGVAGDAVAAALATYFESCRRMWANRLDGSGPTGPFVAVRRRVHHERQSTTSSKTTSKRDLNEAYDRLCAVPVLGPVVHDFLESAPDLDDLTGRGAVFSVSFSPENASSAPDATLLRAHLRPGHLPYGPLPTPGEVRRVLDVVGNHAAWRDRARRRLVEVTVHVDEIWPDPATVVDLDEMTVAADLDRAAAAPTV
jgi:hypothetical protein